MSTSREQHEVQMHTLKERLVNIYLFIYFFVKFFSSRLDLALQEAASLRAANEDSEGA